MSTEYVKRFDNAIANFEAQADKLKEISNVLQAVVSLVSEVEDSKNEIVRINRKSINELHMVRDAAVDTIESVRQIIGDELQQEREALACAEKEVSGLKNQIDDGICKITTYAANEKEARNALVENLTNVLVANGKAAVGEIYSPLEKITTSLEAGNKALAELIRKEEQSADKYIEAVKRTLLLSSSDNIDVVKGLEKSIGYKIDVAETNIKSAQIGAVKEVLSDIKYLQSTVNQLTQSSQEQKELLQKISSATDSTAHKIQHTLFASVAAVFAVICAIIILLYQAH